MASPIEASGSCFSTDISYFRVERMVILYRPLADGVEILRVIHGSLMRLLRREGVE